MCYSVINVGRSGADGFLMVFNRRAEILKSSFQHLDFGLVNNFIEFGLKHFHISAFGLDTWDPKGNWNGALKCSSSWLNLHKRLDWALSAFIHNFYSS